MLRVGLTGNLGSGKSTAAELFARKGAFVLAADALAREMQRAGEVVYGRMVGHFGRGILTRDGELDREVLARIAFVDGRVEELNAIVHPAVIERQVELAEAIFAGNPGAIVIVESALLFESKHIPVRDRFDRIVLVTAPEEAKIERFVLRTNPSASGAERATLEAEGHRRLAMQMPDEGKIPLVDYVLTNDSSPEQLVAQVDELWTALVEAGAAAK